jgi:lauroyl/myristoyl acyltransferase
MVPGSHVRKVVNNYCAVIGRDDPARVFAESVDKIVRVANLYGDLMRHGPERMAGLVRIDETSLERCEKVRAGCGGGIIVLPHCIGSVPVAVGFARRFPSLLLVTESRSATSNKLMCDCFDRMCAEVTYVRRTDPATAARSILRALHEGKFVIGTTDILRRTRDSVEVRMFGRPAHLPAWAARFSSRRNAPIIPGFVRMEGDLMCPVVGEPYIAQDIRDATQRWAAFFEENFRKYPSEWLFLYEKRWAKLLAEARGNAG